MMNTVNYLSERHQSEKPYVIIGELVGNSQQVISHYKRHLKSVIKRSV
jgi:hypothetical protein